MVNRIDHQPAGGGVPSQEHRTSSGRWPIKRKPLTAVAVALISCVLLVGFAAAGERLAYRGKVYPGVRVGGIAVGSKTLQQASNFLGQHATGTISNKIALHGARGKNLILGSKRLGVKLDAKKSAERAYSVGRQGWVGKRLLRMAEADFGMVNLKAEVGFRANVARRAVEGLARELDSNARDASISVGGTKVDVSKAREGYRLDVAATVTNIHRAAQNFRREARITAHILRPKVPTSAAKSAAGKVKKALAKPLVFEARGHRWIFEPARIARIVKISDKDSRLEVSINKHNLEQVARGMFSVLNVEPKSASFSVSGNTVAVIPAHSGLKLQENKLLAELNKGLFLGQHTFAVPTKTRKPSLTTQRAQSLKPTTLIGSYKTDYTWDMEPGQMANYRISSGAVNNTLVAPGKIFSFDDRTEDLHYEPSKVIENGKVKEALGGGLCQISTTLYMAANYAGLKVLERHPHYAQLPYIRPGLDATVWFGSGAGHYGRLDMRFENNTRGYLLLKEWVGNDGYVHAQIWGRPTGKHVRMWSREVASGPGYTKWITYKKVTRNGKVLFDGILHEDIYQPLSA